LEEKGKKNNFSPSLLVFLPNRHPSQAKPLEFLHFLSLNLLPTLFNSSIYVFRWDFSRILKEI
jgi:hypothetical protein